MINRGQLFIDLMSVSAMNVILIDIKQDANRSRSINNALYCTPKFDIYPTYDRPREWFFQDLV